MLPPLPPTPELRPLLPTLIRPRPLPHPVRRLLVLMATPGSVRPPAGLRGLAHLLLTRRRRAVGQPAAEVQARREAVPQVGEEPGAQRDQDGGDADADADGDGDDVARVEAAGGRGARGRGAGAGAGAGAGDGRGRGGRGGAGRRRGAAARGAARPGTRRRRARRHGHRRRRTRPTRRDGHARHDCRRRRRRQRVLVGGLAGEHDGADFVQARAGGELLAALRGAVVGRLLHAGRVGVVEQGGRGAVVALRQRADHEALAVCHDQARRSRDGDARVQAARVRAVEVVVQGHFARAEGRGGGVGGVQDDEEEEGEGEKGWKGHCGWG